LTLVTITIHEEYFLYKVYIMNALQGYSSGSSGGSTVGGRPANNANNASSAPPPNRREMRGPSRSRFLSAFYIFMVGMMMLVIGAISSPAIKSFTSGEVQSTQVMERASASMVSQLRSNALNGSSARIPVAVGATNLRLPIVTPASGTRVNKPNLLNPSNPSNALIAAMGGNNFAWSNKLVKAVVSQKTNADFSTMMRAERAAMIEYCDVNSDCMKFYTDKLKKVADAALAGENANLDFMEGVQNRQIRRNRMARNVRQMKGATKVGPFLDPIVGALREGARGAGQIMGEVPAGASWAFFTSLVNTSVGMIGQQGKVTQGIILIITMVSANFAIGNIAAFLNAIAYLGRGATMTARSAKAVAGFLTAVVSGLFMKAQAARTSGGNAAANRTNDGRVNAAAEEVVQAAAEQAAANNPR
jgi:hypothetical protein